VTGVGFDVEFPAIHQAGERMKSADFETRHLGVDLSGHVSEAGDAAGGGELASALSSLATTVSRSADQTADVVREIWQAIEKAEARYYRSDAAASHDIRAVEFGDHDGDH
jgi:uncharacterized protein YukE